ncbi:MAG: transposase [Elusimicrobia bacterium]|nr:transposase [Elusimicrobiota bacterium]
MPRGQRIFFENAHYHIMDRGNDRGTIFSDRGDREYYLGLLADLKKDFGVLLPAYSLMTNHVHLYIVTPRANLAEAMHALNKGYSQYFNRKHAKHGHLFGDRYKYKVIQSDIYSLALARYIHLNPVKAGLATKAEDYEWSSAAQYLDRKSGLADPGIVLDPLSERREDAIAIYIAFMSEPPERLTKKFWGNFDKQRNMVLGDPEFKKIHSPHGD